MSYTRGVDLSGGLEGAGGIGGLLARTEAGLWAVGSGAAHAYYHADGGGNVTALVSGAGAVVGRYGYDPFGNLVGLAGPLAEVNGYRFSSKEQHGPSGLYYYGFRFYAPSLQRWMNRDPVGEVGGFNLYGFVENNPADFVDPSGLRRYWYDGQQWLWIGPPWWNPYGKGNWYIISPEGAKKLIGKANLEDAIAAAGTGVLLTGMADGGHGNFRTCKDSKLKKDGIDAHCLKDDFVGEENRSKYNIATDNAGNVKLVPV